MRRYGYNPMPEELRNKLPPKPPPVAPPKPIWGESILIKLIVILIKGEAK